MWIIYKNGFGFSRIIAEMIQDRLDDYINVDVGNAEKVDPSFVVEEKLDYLIIGDIISETLHSAEIQNWVLKYGKISKNINYNLKALSGFYIAPTDINDETHWDKFLRENINAEKFFPPILYLKLNGVKASLDIGAFEIVKEYSNVFIEFLIKNWVIKK